MKSLSNHINESMSDTKSFDSENINESAIMDVVSTMTTKELEMLVGAIGSIGLIASATAMTKLVSFVKKKGGATSKTVLGAIEKLGLAAGSASQIK